jgi:hypothetical protein
MNTDRSGWSIFPALGNTGTDKGYVTAPSEIDHAAHRSGLAAAFTLGHK